MSLTVVLFQDGKDVGTVAQGVEVLEDSDTQIVLTATFPKDDEVAGVLAEANATAQAKNVGGVGTAEGEVVGHSGD